MKRNALFAAGILILQAISSPFAIARLGQDPAAGQVSGFVVPKEVGANEPFTFAATNTIEGQVVQVQTIDGEVVATKKADKHGRVFLAAGLAAGAYLLSTSGGKGSGQIQVQPPRNLPPGGSMQIPKMPATINASEGLQLSGQGLCPDASKLMATFGGKEFPVLAGTATEMKTGPLPESACGIGDLEVKNSLTGEALHQEDVACYQLTAKLSRSKLMSGEAARLEFSLVPTQMDAMVIATILGGPVSFPGGAKERQVKIENGKGQVPLVADRGGQGAFQVAYSLHAALGAARVNGNGQAKAGDVGQGGKPQPQGNMKRERCPLTKHIRDEATGWETTEKKVADPDNPGKTKTIYIATRTIRCNIHKSCSKDKGHAGDCAFTGKHRCKDHDKVEVREYDSDRARKDGMKDTAIPADLKYP